MLRFSLFKIPIRIEWFFWLSCAILGNGLYARGPEAWMKVVIWVIVAFISIMTHELGHAFAAREFGQKVAISLHALGGLTHFSGPSLTRIQRILVSLAGPGAGFALGFFAYLTFPFALGSQTMQIFWTDAIFINVVWTIINLLPIMPMDGGQVMRDVLGPARVQIARVIGAAIAVLAAFFFGFYLHDYFPALVMAALAYINFKGIRQPGGVVRDNPA